ncbi:MAG: hypothetical protein Nk1A_1210 [Endomicrobiia bacterium]|nr:MAG: hypothetical protein Nk1A_1210 [Endomicrobiia bacterium]
MKRKKTRSKKSTLLATWYKYIVDINKVQFISLEETEFKIRLIESQFKVLREIIVKNYHARIKKQETYIKFL